MQEDNEVFISDLEDRATHGTPKCGLLPLIKFKSPLCAMSLERVIVEYFKQTVIATKLYLSQKDYNDLLSSGNLDAQEEQVKKQIKKQHTPVEIVFLSGLETGTGYMEFLNENSEEANYIVGITIRAEN